MTESKNDATSNAAKVLAFHRAIGAQMPTAPQLPSAEILALREALLDEEYKEVKAALRQLDESGPDGRRDPAETVSRLVHELADLLYVTYGAILACGVNPDPVFAEVHRANMQKTHGPRRADGKQLKPADWQPADVAGVVRRQTLPEPGAPGSMADLL